MNQKRQPKGTDAGGQFAPDVNPESTVDLGASRVATGAPFADAASLTAAERTELGMPTIPVTAIGYHGLVQTTEDAVTWSEGELERIEGEYAAMVDAGKSEDPDALELRDQIDELRDQLVGHQRDLIAELRKDREENPSLDDIIVARAADRLSDPDDPDLEGSEATDPTSLVDDYKRYSLGMHDRNFDGTFEGIDYVIEQFIDWRETEKTKHAGHEGPFQIGSVLEYDVEVVPWVPNIHEENVAVQVWMKEWGDADTDCAGWEPRAIAQIARERGITNVTNRDLQDILDDPDISKIAFRSDTSIARLIEQINDCNLENAKPSSTLPF